MEEDGERRVWAESSGDEEVDRLSNLPESLLCEVLLNLPTKDVVKISVLSSRWRNLWRYVPGLDLECDGFPDCIAFVTFVDRFLGFSSQSLQNFKLKLNYRRKWDKAHVTRWIDTVLGRKVQHIHLLDTNWGNYVLEMPLSIYKCESLVSLKLSGVILLNPKSVSLPCVKVINLDWVKFPDNWAFEILISGCPLLESLTIDRRPFDDVKFLRVCSQSLLSFTYVGHLAVSTEKELVVAIDAPRLKKLQLHGEATDSFIINNMESLTKVGLGNVFNPSPKKRFDPNDLPNRNRIRNFLLGISSVKDMTITLDTLEVIYDYSRCEPLPLFRNLSSLGVDFDDYRWEMLPIFLESCPNLKSLSLVFTIFSVKEEGVSILLGPRRFLTSLEYVKIINPMAEQATEINLVSYFLKNSTVLKELTYCLSGFKKKEKNEVDAILKKLLAIPRLSSSCQIILL